MSALIPMAGEYLGIYKPLLAKQRQNHPGLGGWIERLRAKLRPGISGKDFAR